MLIQFLMMAVIAVLVAIPAVRVIPRERHSPLFDRILWVATMVVGFLIAWLAIGFASADSRFDALSAVQVLGLPVVIAIIGALAGTLGLNLPLWLFDVFEPPVDEGDADVDEGEEDLP